MVQPILNSPVVETVHVIIGWVALGIELLAVAVIGVAVIIQVVQRGTVRYLFHLGAPHAYEDYRNQLDRALLLGLGLLVAADVVRTVSLEATVGNVALLGLLVLVRTFLSWTMTVETEGRWPWQPRPRSPQPPPGE